MKQDRLSRCLGGIDPQYVEEAERPRKSSRSVWLKWGAAAACLCIVAAVTSKLWLPPLRCGLSLSNEPSYAVNIPAVELPTASDGVMMDMVALVVYQGHVYTHSGSYFGEDSSKVAGLVGEHLGYATGGINEWSTQDEYAKEFASNIQGDIYTVNGYDIDFRLCLKGSYMDENNKEVTYIEFFDHLNGIGLNTGEDLFGTRLHLRENWESARYQTHENWDNSVGDYRAVEDTAALGAFLDALYEGRFENLYESNPDMYALPQTHMYFSMKDGTTIELRLFEGGYVSYQSSGFGGYSVKMSGDAFDAIYQACR